MKHKCPEQSPGVHWEEERPSRIDFGKSKYGGPFKTEQVEDVKTFFGGLGMISIISAVFGITDENFRKTLEDKAMRERFAFQYSIFITLL